MKPGCYEQQIEPYPPLTEQQLTAFLTDWEATGAPRTAAYYHRKRELAALHDGRRVANR